MTQDDRWDLIFLALSDRTRRRILDLIAKDSLCVTDIASGFDMSLNAISKHLMVLEKAGLLVRTKDGRIHNCRMNPKPLEEIRDLVAHYSKFWEKQLDGLEAYLEGKESDFCATRSCAAGVGG